MQMTIDTIIVKHYVKIDVVLEIIAELLEIIGVDKVKQILHLVKPATKEIENKVVKTSVRFKIPISVEEQIKNVNDKQEH